ncbi:MAG: restriction endonuclease subunit S [Lachnospiraceae bacterium]|nr:restriction endonuclease subunit S [Lachnospiraceae bacterium]
MPRQMKDSGVKWIGNVPKDWNIVPIKYLCSMQAGKTLSSEQISEEGVYPVYGGNGQRGFYTEYNTEGEYLLIGRQGALCGNVHLVEGRFWATEHALVTTPSNYSDIAFLYYLLVGMNLNQYVSSSAAQPGLSVSTISNISTCLVPMNEQKRIAAYLEKQCNYIDGIFTKTSASIEEYKKLKQVMITQAVTKGIHQERSMKESGISWLTQIPEEWTVERGKNLFVETKELSNTGDEELLTVSHITGVTPRSEKNVNMFMAESLVGYKICHEGDLAANTMWMWQGAIGVSKHEGVISPSYNTYRQRNNEYVSEYLEYLLRIPPLVATYAAYSTGITASRLRLYPDQLFSILFPVPPKAEQIEIVSYLNGKIPEMDRLIQKKEQFLVELENYKKSMIYEYVTGKKEVPQL